MTERQCEKTQTGRTHLPRAMGARGFFLESASGAARRANDNWINPC
jgi:hypothetical protein